METVYVERDCTFTFEGRTFESGGAIVTDDAIVAYPRENGVLGDWHGNPIGTWKVTSSWPVRSYIGSRMYQIRATLDDGRTYTGRGFGEGMIYRGKRTQS